MSIDKSSGMWVDEHGRHRLFHGVNAVFKSFPWHPDTTGQFDPQSSMNAEDISNLRSWGFNAVRLGVMWHGVEPAPGVYNHTYLQVMRTLVDDLHAAGIYTIVDFHQDIIAEKWCGEGVPAWLVPMLDPVNHTCNGVFPTFARLIGECTPFSTYNFTTDPDTGFPFTSQCLMNTFDDYYRTPDVASAWSNFYHYRSVQEKFEAYWNVTATAFKGAPGVIGYDIVNEPLPGNFYEDPSLVLAGTADRRVLQEMYQRVFGVIRKADPEAVGLYEPTPFPDVLPVNIPVLAGVHPSGFTEGPDPSNHQQAMSYHIYSCGFADINCDRNGDPRQSVCEVCDKYAIEQVELRHSEAYSLGGSAFITEFGACSGAATCIAEIDRVTSLADTQLHSWAYWQFKYFNDITTVSGPLESFYNDDGSLQTRKVRSLSRTYASAIAGIPLSVEFAIATGAFRLIYTPTAGATKPTEIFLNAGIHYPAGYDIQTFNCSVNHSEPNLMEVRAVGSGQVDIAFAPLRTATSGTFISADKDVIQWEVITEGDTPSFSLETFVDLTWWKQITIRNDAGATVCSVSMQDTEHGPKSCTLRPESANGFLFNFEVELWKAKFLGHHTKVDTIPASVFGPLVGGKSVKLTWVSDRSRESASSTTNTASGR